MNWDEEKAKFLVLQGKLSDLQEEYTDMIKALPAEDRIDIQGRLAKLEAMELSIWQNISNHLEI